MALSACNTEAVLDKTGKEIMQRGSSLFPLACFFDNVSKKPIPLHWHDEIEAFAVVSGKIKVMVGVETVTLSEHESILINSGILHGISANSNKECGLKCICWEPSITGGRENSVFWQNYTRPFISDKQNLCYVKIGMESENDRKMNALILEAWQQCADEPKGYEIDVRYELSKLISIIIANKPKHVNAREKNSIRQEERLKMMLAYIHLHYADKITIRQIADYAMVSTSEVLRCFRMTLGISPIKYTKNYRLEKAALALEHNSSVSEVAYSCGFNDMSYFAKEFKKKYGKAPNQFKVQ